MKIEEVCTLCGGADDSSNTYGPLVCCRGCNLHVHEECYGVENVANLSRAGKWACDVCSAGVPELPPCSLCMQVYESPMIPVTGRGNDGKFAHIMCALPNYDVSVDFGDARGRRGVDLSAIPPCRANLVCMFCETSGGGAVECQVRHRFDRKYCHNPPSTQELDNTIAKSVKKKCSKAFHPTCAVVHGGAFFFTQQGTATCACTDHAHPDVITLLKAGTLRSGCDTGNVTVNAHQRLLSSNKEVEARCLARSVHTARFYEENQSVISLFYPDSHRDPTSRHWQKLCTPDKNAASQGAPPPRINMEGRQPAFINGTMKDYQIAGLQWLLDLDATVAGGILGDEMGLGKTIQTCSFLGQLHSSSNGGRGPHLVVCPLSVLDTWRTELARWTPGLRVAVFYSNEEGRHAMKESELVIGEFDVCVTTYEMCVAEHSYLVKRMFDWVVLDEGTRIKGADTHVSIALRSLRSYGRLILTGTPLQNNMGELWPLINFILPAGFPESHTRASFVSAFSWAEEEVDGRLVNASSYNRALVNASRRILSKLMLRRTKASVTLDIPGKEEKRVFLPMSPMQVEVYKDLLKKDAGMLSLLGKNHGGSASELTKLSNLAMQLRKCTGHPFTLKGVEPPNCTTDMLVEGSSKLVFLEKLLPSLQQKGEKVVIFSSFTCVLDCVEDFLTGRGYIFYRLDGSTASALRTFQTTNFAKPNTRRFIFLVSTRAGGLGLNLQAANNAVFMDSDWNPAIDLQAQMRVHRIGQTRKVNIFRLVCKSTIEEEKQSFADLVIDEGDENLGQQEVGVSVLKDAVLCGASGVLERTSLQVTADFDEFKNASVDDLIDNSGKCTKMDTREEVLNVDSRLFDGLRTQRVKTYKDVAGEMASTVGSMKRKRVSTVEMHYGGVGVGQIAVSKESLEQERHNEALEMAAAKRRMARAKNQKIPINYFTECCIGSCPLRKCKQSAKKLEELEEQLGELVKCSRCPVVWHPTCAYNEGLDATTNFTGQISCFAHRCNSCNKSGAEAAGALFRCVSCHRTVCQDDIDHESAMPADDTGCDVHEQQLKDLVLRVWKIPGNVQFIQCGCGDKGVPASEPIRKLIKSDPTEQQW